MTYVDLFRILPLEIMCISVGENQRFKLPNLQTLHLYNINRQYDSKNIYYFQKHTMVTSIIQIYSTNLGSYSLKNYTIAYIFIQNKILYLCAPKFYSIGARVQICCNSTIFFCYSLSVYKSELVTIEVKFKR